MDQELLIELDADSGVEGDTFVYALMPTVGTCTESFDKDCSVFLDEDRGSQGLVYIQNNEEIWNKHAPAPEPGSDKQELTFAPLFEVTSEITGYVGLTVASVTLEREVEVVSVVEETEIASN